MGVPVHRQGQFRRWLGATLGGDEALGDRAWRRILHVAGAGVLIYFALPDWFFLVAPKEYVLLAALAAMFLLELVRHTSGLELPSLRPYETTRVASYVFYALALVIAVLLFPLPIAAAVVLGTAIVDPVAGELRRASSSALVTVGVPLAAYEVLGVIGLSGIGHWPLPTSAALALGAGGLAVAAERPKWPWVDDDLAMTILPALFLFGTGVLALGLPG